MASTDKGFSLVGFEGIGTIIDSFTSLYNAVSAKSPLVADTVVLLAGIFPFYLVYSWGTRLKARESAADKRVRDAKKHSKKPGKGSTGGSKK